MPTVCTVYILYTRNFSHEKFLMLKLHIAVHFNESQLKKTILKWLFTVQEHSKLAHFWYKFGEFKALPVW